MDTPKWAVAFNNFVGICFPQNERQRSMTLDLADTEDTARLGMFVVSTSCSSFGLWDDATGVCTLWSVNHANTPSRDDRVENVSLFSWCSSQNT